MTRLLQQAGSICKEALPTFSTVTDGKHFDELDAQGEETVRYNAADSDFAHFICAKQQVSYMACLYNELKIFKNILTR